MQAPTATTEIKTLEDRRYKAMLNNDVATLDQLLSDKLVYTHSNGQRDTKGSIWATSDRVISSTSQ